MKQQPQNQASGASETTRFFCTQISPAAGAAGELKQHKKEPNMANKKNTTPGIGESADSEVMHNPQPSRARTRTRGMSYGDINNIQFSHIIEALAKHRAWEGQRPRCPRFAAVWATRTLPLPGFAGVSIVHES